MSFRDAQEILKNAGEQMGQGEEGRIPPIGDRSWSFGHCELRESTRQLLIDGVPVKMEAKPLDVLQCLLERPKEIVPKAALLAAGWDTHTTDQSLSTAMSKLRKAFGFERGEIIVAVSGIGYRMNVEVTLTFDREPASNGFHLEPGQPMPGREQWIAERSLGFGPNQHIWIARNRKTREARVFKFATDGLRLRTLQREVALSRLFQQQLSANPGFLRVLEWNFDTAPYCIESEYSGVNLYEFSETEVFRQMPLEERVAFAAQLTEIIAATHSLGILHNDLKPSNILVVADELGTRAGAARVRPELLPPTPPREAAPWQIKVVDFGVGSFAAPERLLEMEITHYGAFEPGEASQSSSPLGTAMYCAPEMRVRGATPSVLGDIYALGVILYQIASGDFVASPEPGWETRIPDPLLRSDIAAAANVDPAARLQTPAELAARLRNLDQRRAEKSLRDAELAAAQLAEQELRRLRQRRPWLIATAVALCLGLCASLWFYRRAAQQRDAALAATAHATRIEHFLEGLFSGGSEAGPSKDLTVVAVLQTAVKSADSLSNDPGTQADFYQTLGSVYGELGSFPEADRLLQNALDVRVRVFGRESPDAARALDEISRLREEEKRYEEASQAARQAIDIDIRTLPPDHPQTLRAKIALASAISELGQNLEAAVLLKAVIPKLSGIPDSDADLSDAETDLSIAENNLGQMDEAMADIQRALDFDRRRLGPNHPWLAADLMSLSQYEDQRGDFGEAIRDASEALRIDRGWFGETHPETAAALTQLAKTYVSASRDKEAVPLLQDALAAERTLYPGPNRALPHTLNALGRAETNLGQFAAAEAHLNEAAEVYRKLYPQGSNDLAVTLANLATTLLSERKYAQASSTMHDALNMAEKNFPSGDEHLIADRILLAKCLSGMKQYAEAEHLLQAAYAETIASNVDSDRIRQDASNACEALNRVYQGLHETQREVQCPAAPAAR